MLLKSEFCFNIFFSSRLVVRVYFRAILRAVRLRLFDDRGCDGYCFVDERRFLLFRLADGRV